MRIDIDGQLVHVRKGDQMITLPLQIFPKEFIALVDRPELTPSQQAQLDRQCFDCG